MAEKFSENNEEQTDFKPALPPRQKDLDEYEKQASRICGSQDFVFERNYHAAVEYYRMHGDLECKCGYIDGHGIKLAAWLGYLRQQYKILGRNLLTEEQFRLLDAIGMRWGSKHDKQWNDCFACLKSYLLRTGNSDVPTTWKEGNVPLGRWLRRQKELYAEGMLRKDRADCLASLGVSLSVKDSWEQNFRLAKDYSETHGGSLAVPHDYVVKGVWLSKWLCEQRLSGEGKSRKKLTEEQKQKLQSIGMVFGTENVNQLWESHYQAVKAYVESTGNRDIPENLRDGRANLRNWIKRQVACFRKGELTPEKTAKLTVLGFLTEKKIKPSEVKGFKNCG